jgi:hypothetical protein
MSLRFCGHPAVWCEACGEGSGEPGFHFGEDGVGGPVGEFVRVGFHALEFLEAVAVAGESVMCIRHGARCQRGDAGRLLAITQSGAVIDTGHSLHLLKPAPASAHAPAGATQSGANRGTHVTDPTCMASLIRHPNGVLLFSNSNDARRRVAMTIRTSDDDGKTWSDGNLLDPGFSMYSSMTVLRNGSIGIVYESGDTAGVVFARFPLVWVSEK